MPPKLFEAIDLHRQAIADEVRRRVEPDLTPAVSVKWARIALVVVAQEAYGPDHNDAWDEWTAKQRERSDDSE
ncbi:MAG: hypothetical protein AAGF91_02885 [Actinomycetota bacterium]